MKPSAYRGRRVDMMGEVVTLTLLNRDAVPSLMNRYRERRERAGERNKRVSEGT